MGVVADKEFPPYFRSWIHPIGKKDPCCYSHGMVSWLSLAYQARVPHVLIHCK